MNKLKKYAGLLNDEAPKDHFLAYITPNEREMLVNAGGSGHITKSGIPSFYVGEFGGMDFSDSSSGSAGDDYGNGNTGGNDNQDSDETSWSAEDHTPTGWSGDSVVDAWESEHIDKLGDQKQFLLSGSDDYQGTQFTGGTYATDDTPASRTISYSSDIDAPTEDRGRPDITYFEPTGTTMGDWKSKYELNQIKHIQDSKLKTVKGKLKVAGFTDLPKDATFQETKDYITQLNRDGKILDSWENATDKKGNPLYEQTTIDKWKAEGYVPQSPSMQSPGLFGMSIKAIGGAPLSYDQLMNEFNQMEEVGKSGGGAMNADERMKIFSPNQYASTYGMEYNPHTKTFTSRDGGSEQNAIERVNAPYEIGETPPPQESMVAKYFANLNNTNLGINQNYLNTYNTAKANIANTLNMTPNTQQYGYGNTFNDNYARSMTSANPFFEELTSEGLI